MISVANVAKHSPGWKRLTFPLLCVGHRIWNWLLMWVVWGVTLLGTTKEGSIPFCCVGHPCTSGLLHSLSSQVGPGLLWPVAGRKTPKHGKAGCSVWEGGQSTLLVPVLCDSMGFVQLSVLVPLQSCCKPGQGKQIYWSKRWRLFIILILWEGSAVQVLWGSNWSTKNKELTCHGAWERNEKINEEKGVQMCRRMAVAEISACLRNWLSSCITVSQRFCGGAAANFQAAWSRQKHKMEFSLLLPQHLRGGSVGDIAPKGHGRFPAASRDIFTPQRSLPQHAMVEALLSVAS